MFGQTAHRQPVESDLIQEDERRRDHPFSVERRALSAAPRILIGHKTHHFPLCRSSTEAIDAEVRGMGTSWLNALLTRWAFRLMLLKSAYAFDALERMVSQSRFGKGEIREDGIGFDLRLAK